MQTMKKTLKLHDGYDIPILGFGVYQSPPGNETFAAVKMAFEAGYRHVDTASLYDNEEDVGEAVRQSGLRRSEVFVTTKLWNSDHGYDRALKAFDESLQRLGFDYVDLYLLHWPVERKRIDSWRALIEIRNSRRARSIGVSNFTISHLEELISKTGVVPAVNQVEFSPFLFQEDLLAFCRSRQIVLEAYSPLTRGRRLNDPTLARMAKKYSRTPAQLLIRWCLEHDVVALPKSNTPSRIRENAMVFDFQIEAADLKALDSLNENFHVAWDPSDVP